MNVASLELCKELYKLSGWINTTEVWIKNGTITGAITKYELEINKLDGFYLHPAYGLGYLLRKLQPLGTSIRANGFGTWEVETDSEEVGSDEYSQLEFTMNTPEDAACKLAIELFKQGILK